MTTRNRQWRLIRRPKGTIGPDDLEFTEAPVPALRDGDVLVRNIYLSLDPTNRIWMSDMDQYMPPVQIGDVMRGTTLGVVETSKSESLQPGDIVQYLGGFQEYYASPANLLWKIPEQEGVPLTAHLSVLGLTGITAYFCLLEICKPQPDETIVITSAAGAVGSIAGQIAKRIGSQVIGIAGTDEKCRWITKDLHFDGAINYKSEDVLERLGTLCPRGIDADFENVGGAILDAILTHINLNARIAICGLISTYNVPEPVAGPTMFRNILMKRAIVQGFIVTDYWPRRHEAIDELSQWIAEGDIQYQVDVADGLENALIALDRIFTGKNRGKQLVKICAEP